MVVADRSSRPLSIEAASFSASHDLLLIRGTGRRRDFCCYAKDRVATTGFSLIELVVVIAILSVLTAIALPRFLNIRKDAQISQAKNALATIIKECKVAEVRGKSTLLADISSARASLSGYMLSTGQLFGQDFLAEDCYRTDLNGAMLIEAWPVIPAAYLAGTQPTKIMPIFAFEYNRDTGEVTRSCQVWSDAEYLGGCENLNDAPLACGGLGQPRCRPLQPGAPALKNGTW